MARGIISKVDNLKILKNVVVIWSGSNSFSEFDITGLTKLTTLGVGGNLNLSEAAANSICINLDDYGLLDGSLHINKAPTGDGAIAKDNLIAKGWSVFIP